MRAGKNVGGDRAARGRGLWGVLVAVVTQFVCPLGASGQQLDQHQAAVGVQQAMVEAIASAERSVVAIARVRKHARGLSDQPGRDGFPAVRGGVPRLQVPPSSPDFVPQEFATGVVIDRDGHILTNYHVLGKPQENDYYVWVQRRPFRATRVEVPEEVRAGDPWTDLAVLKIAADDLQPIRFGDTSKLRKGMFVIALGNPYGIARDGEASASWGIISNLRRAVAARDPADQYDTTRQSLHQFGTLIQTDASLNLGTSGGALINLEGEMIGLTTSLAALTGYEQPAGFAIPVDEAFRQTLETLKQGRVPSYGFLGVQPESLSLADRQAGKFGARVSRVVPGTPADQAGLREDDVITHVDDDKVF
ncbi:MAG: trypsin-like peptidase domain-containing protein, partial [Pirellulaceae bacterium]